MQIAKIENNTNYLVKKHNDLVHARYALSEQAIKLFTALIAMIRQDDEDFKEYIFTREEFRKLLNTKSNNVTQEMKNISLELLDKKVFLKKEKSILGTHLIISSEYFIDGSYLKLKIHDELKPYLLELKNNYLTYDIKNVLALRSAYVIRLYELCKNELNKNKSKKYDKKHTFEITVEDFRGTFEIPKTYQYSSHIKKLILEKAQKQFKEKTDITIEYKEIKLGRKVYALSITIFENIKNSYLRDIESFIKYLKSNHVNDDLIEYIPPKKLKTTISINTKGLLYSKNYLYTFTKKQSREIFEELYSRALDGKLPVLNQAKLF